jgi:hypothetical protein
LYMAGSLVCPDYRSPPGDRNRRVVFDRGPKFCVLASVFIRLAGLRAL